MSLKDRTNKLLSITPSNEDEAKELLIAISILQKEMSEDVKKDITPHYIEIELARDRYKEENTALYQKRTHAIQELIRFIENV